MKGVALVVLLSIAAVVADDKDKSRFAPGPASSYAGHQTMDKITIAAVPYVSEEQVHAAFGKVNPNRYGVLPVLAIIENGTDKALRLELRAEFIGEDGKHLDATPASDVVFIGGDTRRPKMPGESPLPFPRRSKRGPLNVWETEGRAFSAKLLPAGESVHGFFYFQTEYRPGSKLYLTGVKDAASGKDFFYFEVPIQ
jgi:hypothetical protein